MYSAVSYQFFMVCTKMPHISLLLLIDTLDSRGVFGSATVPRVLHFSAIHVITSAMHNIIASERSGVECARDEIYAHCEITITRI